MNKILFLGNTGVGKSFLASLLHKKLTADGECVFFDDNVEFDNDLECVANSKKKVYSNLELLDRQDEIYHIMCSQWCDDLLKVADVIFLLVSSQSVLDHFEQFITKIGINTNCRIYIIHSKTSDTNLVELYSRFLFFQSIDIQKDAELLSNLNNSLLIQLKLKSMPTNILKREKTRTSLMKIEMKEEGYTLEDEYLMKLTKDWQLIAKELQERETYSSPFAFSSKTCSLPVRIDLTDSENENCSSKHFISVPKGTNVSFIDNLKQK